MIITNLKINGMTNPIGYVFSPLSVTFATADFTNEEAKALNTIFTIQVSLKEDFDEILFSIDTKSVEEQKIDLELQPRTRYFVRVLVNGEETHAPAFFETGKGQEDWQGKWIGMEHGESFHPVFHKEIYSVERIKSARLYICGLGLYEAYINGMLVGDECLNGGIYDYHTELQYQTYDVTALMGASNDIRIMLGKGWYMGRFGLEGADCLFGDRFQMIAELHITYESGRREVTGTDETWRYYGSDVEESGIYDGEIYNHLLWKPGENLEKQAVVVEENRPLTERIGVPIREKGSFLVREVIHTEKGETVLDFGQNMAGFVSFYAELPKGTRVVLDYGEVLQEGCFYNENYRSAKAQFIYVADGEKENVWPHFTYYGFRYVRVSGWPGEVDPKQFTAHVIYSDLDRTGYFTSSNKKVNKLYENVLWGQCSNFVDIPTDCPQRDERMGWTGDAQVFAPTASYNMDTRAFYRKFLYDLRKEQLRENGGIPNYIPSQGNLQGSCSIWGDAGTFIPDLLSKVYGNMSDYENEYRMMKDWAEYCIRTYEKEDYLVHDVFGFGDWLALDGVTEQSMRGGTDDDYIASIYYYATLKKTADMAEKLQNFDDSRRYRKRMEKVYDAILREYFTLSGHLSVDTQTGFILALRFGIWRRKEVLIKDYKRRLKRDGYRIRAGFAGAPVLCQTLAEHGMEQEAYHFLLNEDFPGWLHEVNLGATTIWERWNSLTEDGKISGTGMNSLNHYAYGNVAEFLYAYVGGIRTGKDGFKEALIAPAINGRLTYAECRYESIYGRYSCRWDIEEDGRIQIKIEIPYGCKAEVKLPGYEKESIQLQGGCFEFSYMPEKNYRCIFDEESFLGEVVKNEAAAVILQKLVPQALFLGNGDLEGKTIQLGELQTMFYMGINPEKCYEAIQQIKQIAV